MLTPDDLPDLPDTIGALFFGGISLVGEPCGGFYEALMLRAAADRVTMIDPNIRPGFIRDEAAYRARIGRMIGAADLVKLSDEDLRWLSPQGGADISALARALLATGPKVVFVTEGAEGARAITARDEVAVPASKVTVADTVGAGDTFNAGILAALSRDGLLSKGAIAAIGPDDLRAALTLGVRAAAVTVSRPGANPRWAKELGL
jgi:fructokinase